MPSDFRLLIAAPSWNQGRWGKGRVLAPPLILPHLAGLTPPGIDITLVDEHVEPIDVEPIDMAADYDLVALTCMTASSQAAYDIADAFRERGIPVVMGGIHPTVMPEEAGEHADGVIVGEAEMVWKDVLADAARGKLQERYRGAKYCDMKGLPLPRRDLLPRDRYLTVNVVQTSRGCPHGCTFCSVSTVAGKVYRLRPVPEVIEEVRLLSPGWLGFVDDNIAGNHDRAKELFEALIPLKIRWVGQADLKMAKDPELLRLAALSGCQAMFIGLESLSPENLRATHKAPNVGINMRAAIRAIHENGIEIVGSFVLGLDGDYPDVFRKTVRFAQKAKIVAAQFAVLTPFPGTRIRDQLAEEGRILTNDWSRYTMSNVVFQPLHMTPRELERGQKWVYGAFYSYLSIIRRNLAWRRDNLMLRLLVNLSYRGIHRKRGVVRGLPTS